MLESEVKQVFDFKNWYHQIELESGFVTPGINESSAVLHVLNEMGLPKDARGLRILDLGCRDGYFAFELERRGADVIGLDYMSPDKTGFNIAKNILKSKVRYVTDNAYNIDDRNYGEFDIVLCLGLLYHLRNPLLLLDKIYKVLKPGGHLFLETAMTVNPVIYEVDQPYWEFATGNSINNDYTNKWFPNKTALIGILREANFDVKVMSFTSNKSRATVSAIKGTDAKLEYYKNLDHSASIS